MSDDNYFIAADRTYNGLKVKVNDFIDLGYVPTGGVVVEAGHFLQSLVKGYVLQQWAKPRDRSSAEVEE